MEEEVKELKEEVGKLKSILLKEGCLCKYCGTDCINECYFCDNGSKWCMKNN